MLLFGDFVCDKYLWMHVFVIIIFIITFQFNAQILKKSRFENTDLENLFYLYWNWKS